MSKKTLLVVPFAAALVAPPFAAAQSVPWKVVIGSNEGISVAGLPAGTRSFTDGLLGDAGAGLAGVRMTDPAVAAGYWALAHGTWTPYTRLGVTGAALGPGRTGGEASHVFLSVNAGGSGAGPDGQRVVIARAGLAGDTTSATWGVWRWNRSANVELVRGLTDGALGPNLGANWVYQNDSSAFQGARAMGDGRVLVNGYVTSPTGLSRLYLAQAVPGAMATPCAMKDSTDANLAPGLSAGDRFDTTWNFGDLSVTPSGRVYGTLHTNQGRDGIWKLCDGAPQALVVDNETGARGPDIGVDTAIFVDVGVANPGDGDNLYFFATFRDSPSDTSRTGLFWHGAGGNRPLAMNDATGTHGPGWPDATWQSFSTSSLTSAGEWSAFQGALHASDGGTPSGMWRVRAGGAPEIVALIGLIGQYAPEPGRTWDAFYGNAVLSNGDIVVSARTQPGSEYAIWLLKADGTKRRVLKAGQAVTVPTAGGNLQASVVSYDLPSGAAPYSRGGDAWIGADGSMLVDVNLTGWGRALITGTPSNPVDLIFRDGFEG